MFCEANLLYNIFGRNFPVDSVEFARFSLKKIHFFRVYGKKRRAANETRFVSRGAKMI